MLRRSGGGYVVEDEHSTSGTRINHLPLVGPTPGSGVVEILGHLT